MIIKRENSGGGYVAILVSNLEIGENYTMTCDGRVYVYRGAVYSETYKSTNNARNGWSFEADQTSYTIAIIINSNEIPNVGDTMNCGKVQLEKGSSATSFEPYVGGIPSPSPRYPQPVNVVSGSNQITICRENFAEFGDRKDTTKYTYTSYQADNIDVEKTTTGGSFYASFKLHIPTPGRYKFRGEVLYGSQSFYIYSDFLYGATIKNGTFSQGAITYSYDFPKAGTYYLGLDGSSVRKYGVQDFMCLPSESTLSTYEMYQGNTYPINLPVKNLLDKSSVSILNAFINPTGYTLQASDNTRTLYISCKPNTTYTISKVMSSRFVVGTSTSATINTTMTNGISNANKPYITITSRGSDTYLLVFYYNGSYDTLTPQQILDTIQIEEGSKANAYTPYGTTPIEMCNMPNTTNQDYFYKDNGNWHKYNAIGKAVLNGGDNETWYRNNTYGAFYILLDNSLKAPNNNSIIVMSDNFKSETANNAVNSSYDYCIATNTLGYTWVRYNSFTTTDQLKTWLSTHNTNAYYVLDTPTTTQITYQPLIDQLNAIEQAMSQSGQTNIMQNNNDLPFILSVSALSKEV